MGKRDSHNLKFTHLGFYLHACWQFNHPFAVRSWDIEDYRKMFKLLRLLGYDRVMLWPMAEIIPPGITGEEQQWLEFQAEIIAAAKTSGLECWIVLCPDLTCTPDIRAIPVVKRHFYPFMKTCRGDIPGELEGFLAHFEKIISLLNNASGYVVIDGDPGSYPGAPPEEFIRILHALRQSVDRHGIDPDNQKIIPWLWSGWGAEGVWKSNIRNLTMPVLDLLKSNPIPGAWELLPGRSYLDKTFVDAGGHANGRVNIAMVDEAGLIAQSTLMLYELIEFEPTPPASFIQYENMRKVFRKELKFANYCRGVFGNAQQPVMSLPNLYAFSRMAQDFNYIDKSDIEIMTDFAAFLGGDPELLVPAWDCANLELHEIPADLPEKLRQSEFLADAAQLLPGGPGRYLEIIASFVEARIAVLRTCSSKQGNIDSMVNAITAIYHWWQTHQYVFDGKNGICFNWSYTHYVLRNPLRDWVEQYVDHETLESALRILTGKLHFSVDEVEDSIKFFNGIKS